MRRGGDGSIMTGDARGDEMNVVQQISEAKFRAILGEIERAG